VVTLEHVQCRHRVVTDHRVILHVERGFDAQVGRGTREARFRCLDSFGAAETSRDTGSIAGESPGGKVAGADGSSKVRVQVCNTVTDLRDPLAALFAAGLRDDTHDGFGDVCRRCAGNKKSNESGFSVHFRKVVVSVDRSGWVTEKVLVTASPSFIEVSAEATSFAYYVIYRLKR
jgi:hypothetical protein